MSEAPGSSWGEQQLTVKENSGRVATKSSSRRASSAGSRSSSSQWEGSGSKGHQYSRDVGTGCTAGGSEPRVDHSLPSTSRDEVISPLWTMMMEALAELRKDMDTLKEKSLATEVGASAEASASACINSQAPAALFRGVFGVCSG